MHELFIKGGIVMWVLFALSVFALAIWAHRYFLLLALMKSKQNILAMAMSLDCIQRGIDNLYLICAVAPLLGLLGTVFGIIKSFATLSVARPDSQILSLGLSEALFTTAAGLIISIPCQIAGHLLQQKMDRFTSSLKKDDVA